MAKRQRKLYDHPRSQPEDNRDFTDQYNTKLTDEEEAKYQKWAKENKREKDTYDYDMRGAWKSGVGQADNGHFPDTYKKPNHPTFSDESQYHGKDDNEGGKWSEKDGRTQFKPGKTNKQYWKDDDLTNYFKEREPDADLLPDD